jgi:hypothetical protein
MRTSTTSQPFWEDDFDPYTISVPSVKKLTNFLLIYRMVLTFILLVGIFALFFHLSPLFAWFWLFFLTLSVGTGLYRRRKLKNVGQQTLTIQEHAQKQTGAIVIGSAVHVAGHPKLDRELPVVLALVESGALDFYNYNGSKLDTLSLDDILSLHTVVYDDERIPHIEAVDSTAQALQITFLREGKQFSALLRRMKKVRPIDWYHLLQKNRLGKSLHANQA